MALAQGKERSFAIFDKGLNVVPTKPQEANDIGSGAVAKADPDDFRRRPTENAQSLKVLPS